MSKWHYWDRRLGNSRVLALYPDDCQKLGDFSTPVIASQSFLVDDDQIQIAWFLLASSDEAILPIKDV